FIDVNDLNEVNNFVKKQVDGDTYIRYVSEAVRTACQIDDSCEDSEIRKNRKDTDWVFRIGGDELVLMVPNVDDVQLFKIMERIQTRLLVNTNVQDIFSRQRDYTLKKLEKILMELENKGDSMNIRKTIDKMLKNKDYINASDFRQKLIHAGIATEYLLDVVVDVYKANRFYPSVSMGSTYIYPGDNYPQLLERTSEQAYQVKSEFNIRRGMKKDKTGAQKVKSSIEEEKYPEQPFPRIAEPIKL
ncbi:MAG: GGDEF domain-containing protein, partial [Bdellovibrionales bacterium]|nr:GGDEF domain-containing protein [Bdellovibrionales bacterium]